MDRVAARRIAAAVVVLLWTMALAIFGIAGCGGTTGRPDMGSTGADGGATGATATEMDGAVEPGVDATVGEASTGPVEFDATIMYADAARLPHFDFDAGADAGAGEAAPQAAKRSKQTKRWRVRC